MAMYRAVAALALGLVASACASPAESAPASIQPGHPSAAIAGSPSASLPPAGLPGPELVRAYVDFWKSAPLVFHAEMIETVTPTPGVSDERYVTTWDVSGTDLAFVQAHWQGDQATESWRILLGGTAFSRDGGGEWTSSARGLIAPLTARTVLMLSGTDDPAKLRDAGTEMVDGRMLHHLLAADPLTWQIGNDITTLHEFEAWVEDDGTPVMARFANPPEANWAGSTCEMRFSEVGGPIVIKPPLGIPAITPMPFATPEARMSAGPDPAGWIRYVSPDLGYSVALPPALPYSHHYEYGGDAGEYDQYWGSLSSAGPSALLYVSCHPAADAATQGALPSVRPDLTADGVAFSLDRLPMDTGADVYKAGGVKGDTLCALMIETEDSDAAWATFQAIVPTFRFPNPAFVEPSPSPSG